MEGLPVDRLWECPDPAGIGGSASARASVRIYGPWYGYGASGVAGYTDIPEEGKYGDMAYAEKAYGIFTEDLKNSATTRRVSLPHAMCRQPFS